MNPQSEIPATLIGPQLSHNPQPEIRNPQSPFLNSETQTPNPPSPDPRPLNPADRPRRDRPPRLDEPKRREICALISTGAGIPAAARYVGCAASTIHRESRRNDEFRQELRRACLAAELAPLNAVRQAAAKYWRAGAWLLERIAPERFAKQNVKFVKPEQLAGFVDYIVEIFRSEVHDEQLRRRIIGRLDQAIAQMNREMQSRTESFQNPRRSRRRANSPAAKQPSASSHYASNGSK